MLQKHSLIQSADLKQSIAQFLLQLFYGIGFHRSLAFTFLSSSTAAHAPSPRAIKFAYVNTWALLTFQFFTSRSDYVFFDELTASEPIRLGDFQRS